MKSSHCPLNCDNHGTCKGSVCDCHANYEGDDCSVYDEPLIEGVPASNSVRQTEWKYYQIQLHHSGVSMSWWLNQTTNDKTQDCDLYVEQGALPESTNFLSQNISTLQNLHLIIVDVRPGTYYAGVYGYLGCSYAISVEILGACPDDCSYNGMCVQGACHCYSGYNGENCALKETRVLTGQIYESLVEPRNWDYYSFMETSTVEAIEWVLTKINPVGGDGCDLYVKKYSYPSLWDWDFANVSMGDVMTIRQTEVIIGGTYYLGVYGYTGCRYNLVLNEVFLPNPDDCPNNCSNHGQRCSQSICTCNDKYIGIECGEYTESLQLNQVVTGYVGDNTWNDYHIDGDTENSLVITFNRTDPCDLYVRAKEPPTRTKFSYQNNSFSRNLVRVVIPEPNGEKWYIGIFAWHSCTYAMTITPTSSCGCSPNGRGSCQPNNPICVCDHGWSGADCSIKTTALVSGIPFEGSNVTNTQWRYFSIHVEHSTAFSLTVQERNSIGEVWVFVCAEEYPTLSIYDYSDKETHKGIHQISYYTPLEHSGNIYIGVYGSPFIPDESRPGKPGFATFDLVAWVSDF